MAATDVDNYLKGVERSFRTGISSEPFSDPTFSHDDAYRVQYRLIDPAQGRRRGGRRPQSRSNHPSVPSPSGCGRAMLRAHSRPVRLRHRRRRANWGLGRSSRRGGNRLRDGGRLRGPGVTPVQVMKAVHAVVPALELVDLKGAKRRNPGRRRNRPQCLPRRRSRGFETGPAGQPGPAVRRRNRGVQRRPPWQRYRVRGDGQSHQSRRLAGQQAGRIRRLPPGRRNHHLRFNGDPGTGQARRLRKSYLTAGWAPSGPASSIRHKEEP